MKAQRIKIKAGSYIEIYLAREHDSVSYYSSVGSMETGAPDPTQKRVSSGLRATIVIHGPATINLVSSEVQPYRRRVARLEWRTSIGRVAAFTRGLLGLVQR